MQLSSRRLWKRILVVLAGLIGLGLVLFLLRAPLLTAVANALVVSDSLKPADVIFAMGGNAAVRPERAAALYKAGYSSKVAVALEQSWVDALEGIRLPPTLETTHMLQRLGVPRSAITIVSVPGGATSTRQEGRILARYSRDQGYRRVIVVTSELHTRRARWAIRKALKGGPPIELMITPALDPRIRPNNWWRTENGMLECAMEYIKFVHNLTHP